MAIILVGSQGFIPPYSVDFSSLSSGAHEELPGGLVLTRASTATVQTGTSTVDSTPTANQARVGRLLTADPLGLLVEGARTNVCGTLRVSGLNLGPSGCTESTAAGAGPDGSDCDRCQIADAQDARTSTHQATLTTGAYYTAQVWAKRYSAATKALLNWQAVGGSIATAYRAAVSAAWERLVTPALAAVAGANNYLLASYRGDLTAYGGGSTIGAEQDLLLALIQWELGLYPTSAHAGARSADRLYTDADRVVSGGRISLAIALQALGSSAEYTTDGTYCYLWYVDASNYARWHTTTRILTVSIGGNTNTCTLPAWSRHDLVEFSVSAGGSLATEVSARIAGGSASSLAITGSALGAMSSSGSVDLLCSGTSGTWAGFLRSLQGRRRPQWSF